MGENSRPASLGWVLLVLGALPPLVGCEQFPRPHQLQLSPTNAQLQAAPACAPAPADGGLTPCEVELEVSAYMEDGLPAENVRVELSLHQAGAADGGTSLGLRTRSLRLVKPENCLTGTTESLTCVIPQSGQFKVRAQALDEPTPPGGEITVRAIPIGGTQRSVQSNGDILLPLPRGIEAMATLRVVDRQLTVQGLGTPLRPLRQGAFSCTPPTTDVCGNTPRSTQFRIALTRSDKVTPVADLPGTGITARVSLVPESGIRLGNAWLSETACTATPGALEISPPLNPINATTAPLYVCTNAASGRYQLVGQLTLEGSDGGVPLPMQAASALEILPQPSYLALFEPGVPVGPSTARVTYEIRDCEDNGLNVVSTVTDLSDGGVQPLPVTTLDGGTQRQFQVSRSPDAGPATVGISVETASAPCTLSVGTTP